MQQDEAYYDGLNLYEAYRSNPANKVDPLGLAATQPTTRATTRLAVRRIRVSFRGMGPDRTLGDGDHEDLIAVPVGSNLYDWEDTTRALKDILTQIDADHNLVIDQTEVQDLDLGISGYSRGGVAAISLSRDLNKDRERVAGYRLCVKVPVKILVTIDPADFIGVPSVRGNVARAVNYFQKKAGSARVREIDASGNDMGRHRTLGNFASGVIKGVEIEGAVNFRVDTEGGFTDDLWNGLKADDGRAMPRTRQYAEEVNHDTMSRYVAKRAVKELR